MEQVFFVGQLAVKTEELLLLLVKGLVRQKLEMLNFADEFNCLLNGTTYADIDFVLLVGVHLEGVRGTGRCGYLSFGSEPSGICLVEKVRVYREVGNRWMVSYSGEYDND